MRAGSDRRRGLEGAALDGFELTVRHLERAKEALAAAAPRGRSAGVPLAEAVAAFESALADADASMVAWQDQGPEVGERCRRAIGESRRLAERLRLEEPPDGYERLYVVLGDIMDPLDAFAEALGRLRRGRR